MSTAQLDAPPPTYAPSHPQILVAPLPDSASFFWGRTLQGEVFVKGLGQAREVRQLSVQLYLTNHLPDQPIIPLHHFPLHSLYPPSDSTSARTPFPTSNHFSIPLPPISPLPGTLNLSTYQKGEIRWHLTVDLVLESGEEIQEVVFIEGTPQEVPPSPTECAEEVEKVLERDGGKVRLLLDTDRPRLGDLLRLGVEVRALGRQKTGVAGLSAQPNPSQTLRPLRRVRVEFFRRILINTTTSAPSSSTASPDDEGKQHVTLLYASGKSLRYPGTNSQHPPLRVLFTVPTAQLGAVAEQTWGEITMATRYHTVGFFVRVSLGFDGPAADWEIEREIVVRPKLWQMVVSPGTQSGLEQVGDADENMNMTDEDVARVAYRLKGHDMVGQGGTTRVGGDLPPPFEAEGGEGSSRGGLPTFLESEAQMRAGEVPLPTPSASQEGFDRATTVGRRGSLGGELGMWVEYDGYETFSVQPPSVQASFGVGGSMDPPQEGDEDDGRMGGIQRLELMEQLGLGEGTRVVDLQDDLPPGIDEPSLPALPDFSAPRHSNFRPPAHADNLPPSFDASEAAQAVGTAAVAPRDPEAPPGYTGSGQGGPPAYS